MCVCTDRYRRTASLWQIVNDMEEAIKHTAQDGFLMAKDGRRKKKLTQTGTQKMVGWKQNRETETEDHN